MLAAPFLRICAKLFAQMDDLSGDPLPMRLANIAADLENIQAAWGWAAQTAQSTLLDVGLDSLWGICQKRWNSTFLSNLSLSESANHQHDLPN
jgi:hypothetical protein